MDYNDNCDFLMDTNEENTNNMRLIYHQGMKRGGLAAAFVAVKIGAEAHTISRTNSRY